MTQPDDLWHRAIAGLVEAVQGLAAAYPDDARLPAADSEAMAELAGEHQWKVSPDLVGWGPEPVHSAHTIGRMQLRLAFDCAIAMAHLVETYQVPSIYAPTALLRPVLEGAGRALWILETGVGARERVRRGMNERLESLHWQKDLAMSEARGHAKKRLAQMFQAAESLGYQLTDGRRRYLAPEPPSHRSVIRGLFEGYNQYPELPSGLTFFADSISHAGTAGLTAYVELVDPVSPGLTQTSGRLRMTAPDAYLVLSAALMPLVRAGSERVELEGFPGDAWMSAAEAAMSEVQKALGQYLTELQG